MSTQGSGQAALILAPVGLAVGAGILLGKAVMLCGELLEQHYQATCQKLAEAAEAERNFSRSFREPIRNAFATSIKALALARIEQIEQQEQMVQEREREKVEEAAFRQALEDAHAALISPDYIVASPQEVERESILIRLNITIDYCRPLLSPSLIARAERAREGALLEIRQAIEMLDEERSRVESTEIRQIHLRGQLRRTLRYSKTQLDALEEMLREVKSTPDMLTQHHILSALLESAQASVEDKPEEAQQLAEEAERMLQVFTEQVSASVFDAWSAFRHRVSEHVGTLDALKSMLNDAQAAAMAQPALLDELTQRLTTIYDEVGAIGKSTSLQAASRLDLLATRIEVLKESIFSFVADYQQRTIADTIATTLAELGFESISGDGDALQVQTHGDVMRITAMRSDATPDTRRDDKLVTFAISRQGEVHYDFSGYTDTSCTEEAERIFRELRAAGIYLFDRQQAEALQKAYPEGVPASALNQSVYQLHPEADKLQMQLAQRLQTVLEEMRYTHIQQSSVGGFIELDAFNGSLGYRVILSPQGEVQVFKDIEQIDVSHDTSHRPVAESHAIIEEHVAQQSTQEQESTEAYQRQTSSTRKQHHSLRQRKRLLENQSRRGTNS